MTRPAPLAVLAALAACGYSNAMWNAEQFAAEARRLEAQGRADEARGQWVRAAGKAESLPSDAALALRAEALAKSGSCEAAAAPIARALERLTDARGRERVGLAAAECALAAGRPGEAEGALAEARASKDGARRARAEALSKRARLGVAAARAETPADLQRLLSTEVPGSSLRNLVERIAGAPSAVPRGAGATFRAAELARDSLGAPRLAGRMLLDLAAADAASLFAPKALVAALPLLPERHDSILRVLDTAYPASPYTRALHGDPSPAYAAAEDSLAKELGMRIAAVRPVVRAAGNGPSTGPRGPWLEAPRP